MKNLDTNQIEWNLTPLLNGDDDPSLDGQLEVIKRKLSKFVYKWQSRQDYLTSPIALAEALGEYEYLYHFYGTDGKAGYYFYLRTAQDQNNPDLKAKANKVESFSKELQNNLQFFSIRLAKASPATQKIFLKSDLLKNYRHYLEKLFAESKYLLTEPEEKILNLKSSTSHSNWVKMTSGFLSKEERAVFSSAGKKVTKNFAEIASLTSDQNKLVRDSAAAAFNEILLKHSDVAEAEINSILADKKIDDELRGVPRPDQVRHLSDDIDSQVVDSLLESVSARYEISRKYYQLKAKLFGVEKLAYHERNIPYGKVDKIYSYQDSAQLVYKTVQHLDSEFGDVFAGLVNNGQIDVYPKKGKAGGAFCAYNLLSQPTYIFLNHTDKLRDVLTLAHEFGHGVNNELMKKRQNSLNFGTPTSTAEVASTFIEDFVTQEILKDAGNELRLALMVSKLDDEVSTIFRQVACYKFEQELHQKFRETGYLSKENIGQLFQEHMTSYMGPAVEQSPGSENWWVYWSHIRAFFYVYSYSSGLLISKSLQKSVHLNPSFINNVKEFLAAGGSSSPKNIFLKLGINITDQSFWDSGLNEVEELLNLTTALAKKLGKIK